MSRIGRLGMMVAVVSLVSATSAMAQTWEYHTYFGTPSFNSNPGTALNSSDPTRRNNDINPHAGDIVYLPVWVRVQTGDSTSTPPVTQLRKYTFSLFGTAAGGATNAMFSAPIADQTQVIPSGYGQASLTAGNGTAHPNLAGSFQMIGNNTANNAAGPWIASSQGIAPNDAANGAFLLGVYCIRIDAAAPVGGVLRLNFSTPTTTAGYVNISPNSGAMNTVAYGVNAAGQPDIERAGTAGVPVGSSANQTTVTPDAIITIIPVPEPMTMGLAALALLGLRRRVR